MACANACTTGNLNLSNSKISLSLTLTSFFPLVPGRKPQSLRVVVRAECWPAQRSPHDASRGGTPPRQSLCFIAGGAKHCKIVKLFPIAREHNHRIATHQGPPVPHFPTVNWVTVERKPGRGNARSLMCLRRPVIPPPPSPSVPTSVQPTAAPSPPAAAFELRFA